VARRAVAELGDNSIPNLVFFSGPVDPEDVVENNRKFVPPGTEFRYYDYEQFDASARQISEHLEQEAGISGAYAALSNLRPRSFRSDMWRAMIIWEYGGLYLDAKIALTANLTSWLNMSKPTLNICWDMFPQIGFYDTKLLAAAPRSKHLEAVLQIQIGNVQSHSYGDASSSFPFLGVTGPLAYDRGVRQLDGEPAKSCFCNHGSGTLNGWEYSGIAWDTPEHSQTIYVVSEEWHRRMRTCAECDSYEELYDQHAVYCDEPGPIGKGACSPQNHSSLLFRGARAAYWSKVV